MATYKEIKAELEKLYTQAEEARLAEKAEVLDRIKAMIIEHKLLPSDFGFAARASRRSSPVAAKYREPETGVTWSGRGRAPKWLVGVDRSRYEVK